MTTATITYRRDLESAVAKWIEERATGSLVIIPPGYEFDSQTTNAQARWSVISTRTGAPRKTKPIVEGHVRLDLWWSHLDSVSASSGVMTLERGVDSEDQVAAGLLELAAIPLFGLTSWQDGSPVSSTLSGAITDSSGTLTLASAAGFPASGEVVIGAERIAYTGVSSNDLTGLTRGVGETTAFAHATAKAVASGLGPDIGMIKCFEAEVSPIGWDVVALRERTLIRVPFALSYG